MTSKFKKVILSLFVPLILLAITACPGILLDNIEVILGPDGAVVGAVVTLKANPPVAASQIAQILWDFGDGTTGTGNPTTHIYNTGGNLTVTLKIILTNGTVLIYTKTIQIGGQIVFECTDASSGSDICGINFDGSGFATIVDDTNGGAAPGYLDPAINAAGQIVFQCRDATGGFDICAVNFDGSGFTTLVDDTNGGPAPGYFVPAINSAGQIVISCIDSNDGDDICGINFDGSGFTTIVDDTNGVGVPRYTDPDNN